jgi:Uma2 family endonuclease
MQPSRDTRLTYDDFLHFPDDGLRHEIIDGEHYVTPSPNTRHQELVGRLYFEMALHLRSHPAQGRVFLAPFDVVMSRWDVVEPDLLVVTGDQREIVTEQNVQGVPALVVEIPLPGTRRRDEGVKRELFARSGVREYWLVDPDGDTVRVSRRQGDGSFPEVAVLSGASDDALTTPLLPELRIGLRELFARPD